MFFSIITTIQLIYMIVFILSRYSLYDILWVISCMFFEESVYKKNLETYNGR